MHARRAMWLKSWDQLLRIVTIGLPVYLAMIVMLRIAGTRALSKNSAFDSIVSFALGSVLAAAVFTPELPGALALAAAILLIAVQFTLSWLAVRLRIVEKFTTAAPKLLLYEGRVLSDRLRAARLTEESLHAAIRAVGAARVEDVYAVVLETDGSLSVVRDRPVGAASALRGVDGFPSHGEAMT